MDAILMNMIAQERHAEMLRHAERYRAARERHNEMRERRRLDDVPRRVRPRHRSMRGQRLGWLLVSAGLRLAVGGPRTELLVRLSLLERRRPDFGSRR